MKPRTKMAVAALVIIAVVVVIVAYAVLTAQFHITNNATVKTVGVNVYWDAGLTQNVTNISWGIVEPGSTTNRTVYIQNSGNAPANFSISTGNWNPANTTLYITLTWNYTGEIVNPGQDIPVILSLHVSASVTGITDFSFDITITATG